MIRTWRRAIRGSVVVGADVDVDCGTVDVEVAFVVVDGGDVGSGSSGVAVDPVVAVEVIVVVDVEALERSVRPVAAVSSIGAMLSASRHPASGESSPHALTASRTAAISSGDRGRAHTPGRDMPQ